MTLQNRDCLDVAVVGAGIVGLCCALNLQRSGRRVTIFDPLPPGSGSSFGNAGLINVDAHLPVAMPGMLRQVPRWLLDPDGPLTVRPAYVAKAAPWIARWIHAGRKSAVRRAVTALRALNSPAHAEYRRLLGASQFDDLIRTKGGVALFATERPAPGEVFATSIRAELGIEAQWLGPSELRAMFPGIADTARRGLFYPRNGHTVSPARLTAALARLFAAAGGQVRREQVLRIIPGERSGAMLMTGVANPHASHIVIAAGARSRALLDPLGVKIPLETERGYHVHLSRASLDLPVPIIFRAGGFAITPMEDGLRLAGLVEIAGLDAPPDLRRPVTMLAKAQQLFPAIETGEQRIWMGMRPSLPDSVPAIGAVKNKPWLMVAVGHGHDGMIGAPATGRLVADLIQGSVPQIDPARYAVDRF